MAVSQFEPFCNTHSLDIEVLLSDAPTRTAQEAADVHGVPVSAIVKSLLVNADGKFVLCLVPGDIRMDFDRVKELISASEVRMATPEEVKEQTGYSIGGVPPFGHTNTLPVLIYPGFDEEGDVVPAAGAGNAVFKIEFKELKGILQKVTNIL
ncbi:MAG: YbaK/EbsC family protein [Candidatus Dojkabacteria bacterium]|nr:MAG: YbaK/EbsC family protein [Candidatus Dojkabacteria bacterium]